MPAVAKDSELNATATALLRLIVKSDSFKPDLKDLSAFFGLSDSKNIGRKLNTLVKPYGYKWEQGKLSLEDEDDGGSSTPTTKSTKANVEVSENGNSSDEMKTTPRKKKTTTTPKVKNPKTPASKKRKIDEAKDAAKAAHNVKDEDDDEGAEA